MTFYCLTHCLLLCVNEFIVLIKLSLSTWMDNQVLRRFLIHRSNLCREEGTWVRLLEWRLSIQLLVTDMVGHHVKRRKLKPNQRDLIASQRVVPSIFTPRNAGEFYLLRT